jgi:hypothetical protein
MGERGEEEQRDTPLVRLFLVNPQGFGAVHWSRKFSLGFAGRVVPALRGKKGGRRLHSSSDSRLGFRVESTISVMELLTLGSTKIKVVRRGEVFFFGFVPPVSAGFGSCSLIL